MHMSQQDSSNPSEIQNEQQTQDLEGDSLSNQNTPAVSPPPTQQTTPPSIDPVWRETLRELHLENRRQAEELAAMKAKQPEEKLDFNSFVANPEEVVQRAVAKQLAPFQDMFSQFARRDQYAALKSQFLADARFGPALRQYEGIVDDIMAQNEPTAANMQAAIYAAIGNASLAGQPFNPYAAQVPTTQQQPITNQRQPVNNPPSNVPPQARPVAPAAPRNEPPAMRQPTEQERRIMVQMGFNPNDPASLKEYFDYLEAPPSINDWKSFGGTK